MSSASNPPPIIPHSQDLQTEIQNVTFALSTVFERQTPPVPSNPFPSHHSADRFLTSFQCLPIAWVVCDRLLSSSAPAYSQFFAAQTLHFKCRESYYIRQLPPSSLPELRDSLVNHLTTLSSSKATISRLCVTISALAVQMRWDRMIPDILETVFQPPLAPICLELFRNLPEECHSSGLYLTEERNRHEFHGVALRDNSPKVFEFLRYCSEMAGLRTNAMRCLAAWLRYVDVPPPVVEASPLLEAAFGMVNLVDDEEGSEAAADVIVEALRVYGSRARCNEGIVKKMIPLVLNLRGPFEKSLREENEDGLRSYCRIFTEMGESYTDLILSPVADSQNSCALVELVLRCCEIPDSEIANMTLNFWFRFVTTLEGLEPYLFRQDMIDFYTPLLTRLLQLCTYLLKYPEDVRELPPDKVDDLDRDRFYVCDTIVDCCRLLGGDVVLRTLGQRLQEEYQICVNSKVTNANEIWQGIESCLFAIKSISRYVPSDEGVVLPPIMELLSRRGIPQESILLRHTASLTVGRYASWLDTHPTFLQPLLPYLAEGLSYQQSASASALAIKELCESCHNQSLADPVLQLYDNLVQARTDTSVALTQSYKTTLKDELELLEGLCKAVSHYIQSNPTTDPSSILERIIAPIGTRLTLSLTPSHTTSNPRRISEEIERLTVIVRFLKISPATADNNGGNPLVLQLMQQSWSLLQAIPVHFPNDASLAEKLCRLHKHALRKCGRETYAPLFHSLCQVLVQSFRLSHLSPYLYAASIVVSEYGRDPTLSLKLYEMLSALSAEVFSLLTSEAAFVRSPDVVEEFFYLSGRFVSHCPAPLMLNTDMIRSFLKCACAGMRLEHREANKGVCTFMENVVSYGLDLTQEHRRYLPRSDGDGAGGDADDEATVEACKVSLQTAFAAEGEAIVVNLALALRGEIPGHCVDRRSSPGSIVGIVWKFHSLCPQAFEGWMINALREVPDGSQNKVQFVEALRGNMARDDLDPIVRRLHAFCLRRKRLREEEEGGGATELGAVVG